MRVAGIAMRMSKDTTWLIANWKMNGNAARVRDWAFKVNAALGAHNHAVSCVFCPPAPYLAAAKAALPVNHAVKLGGQYCHSAASGAYTGDISAPMLADMGCAYVIVGHSERRAAGETDAEVLAQAHAALAAGLTPVICVGEPRAAYEAKQTAAVLTQQLTPLLQLPVGAAIIAYEPVWAIGSQHTPELLEIEAAHTHIKSVLGSSVTVLYGGSVNAGNIGKIVALPVVSGALIGGASLESESMCALIQAAANIT